MNTQRITWFFWGTTLLFACMMTFSGVAYLTMDEMKQAFVHLGYPAYFRIELAIFKLVGVAVLLLPLPSRMKEWAYAGFFINLISAVIAHAAVGDGMKEITAPVFPGLLIATSYWARTRLYAEPAN